MPKRASKAERTERLRLNPERRPCAKFDSRSTAKFRVASPGNMGFLVIDNCAEEHML